MKIICQMTALLIYSFQVLAVTNPVRTSNVKDKKDFHRSENSLDWAGTYAGTLPCASCPGQDVILVLKEKNKYEYFVRAVHKNKPFQETIRDKFKWIKDGSHIQLSKNSDSERYFVSETYVELVGEGLGSSLGRKAYQLNKLIEFSNHEENLFIYPESVKKTERDGKLKTVQFVSFSNFKKRLQGGHRSLKARYILNCEEKTYALPEIAYYFEPFLQGKLIHETKSNDTELDIKDSPIIKLIFTAYCEK